MSLEKLISELFLVFQNLSQQSDVADLLGGFKPLNAQFVCIPLYLEFENLFATSFSSKVLIMRFYFRVNCLLF